MLYKRLRQVASTFPEKTAIVYGESRINYQLFLEKVERFEQGLKSLEIRKGDCVAILLPNSVEFAIAFYAITALGGIVLPLNHLFKSDEIGYYLDDSNAKAIITDNYRAQICQDLLSTSSVQIELIVTDIPLSTGKFFYDLILDRSPRSTEEDSVFTSTAIYQYSSGSTGRPKRVSRTQKNLICEIDNFASTTELNSEDNILCTVPLYHAHGLGNCLLAATANGATLVILEQPTKNNVTVEVPFVFRCSRVLELIERENITIFPAVPYIFSALAETPLQTDAGLNSLRLCFSAGNFLAKDIFDKFMERYGIPIRQLYGCTEAGSIAINLDSNIQQTFNSVGKPLNNVTVHILDEQKNELPRGEIGEVAIASEALTTGYYNLPELNQQAFQDGTYLTGDLGRIDENGFLYITGRKKILIDTGGRKVDPIEIEDVLVAHPKVKEAVVVGVKGSHAGEIIKAAIVLKNREVCDRQEIFAYCKNLLAEFKIPKIVEFRQEIPKSPLGKILRKALV